MAKGIGIMKRFLAERSRRPRSPLDRVAFDLGAEL